jgi:hypothetical protein
MDEATATTRLEAMTAWDSEPTLTSGQITALVAAARRTDDSFRWATDDTSWAALTAYALATRRAPITRNGHLYEVSTAGTSGASEPTWPTDAGSTVVDGTVSWTEVGASWSPTYDLNAAAAEGWRWKAAKVAGEFDFNTDQQTFNRTGKHVQCLAMAEHYQKRVSGSIRVKASLPILTPPIIPIPADDSFTD